MRQVQEMSDNGLGIISDLGFDNKIEGVLRLTFHSAVNHIYSLYFPIYFLNEPYALIERLIRSRFYCNDKENLILVSRENCLKNLTKSLSNSIVDSRLYFENKLQIKSKNNTSDNNDNFMEEEIFFHYGTPITLSMNNIIEKSWIELRGELDYVYLEENKRLKKLIKAIISSNDLNYKDVLYSSVPNDTIDFKKLIGINWFDERLD